MARRKKVAGATEAEEAVDERAEAEVEEPKKGRGKGKGRKAGEGEEKRETVPMQYRVACLLGGRTPLLLNPVSRKMLEGIRAKQKGARLPDLSFEDEAAGKVLADQQGRAFLPSDYLLSSLVEAGRSVPYQGKSKLSTAESSVVPALITFESESLPLLKADGSPLMATGEHPDWETDVRRGTNPNGGEMVCVVRPRFNEWYIPVVFEVDAEGLPAPVGEDTVRQLYRIAGRKVGLGDFRPDCRGQFGQFIIVQWHAEQVSSDRVQTIVNKWQGGTSSQDIQRLLAAAD